MNHEIKPIKALYRLLGWDDRHAADDIAAWDNPNRLDIEEELQILAMWTRRNQWRAFTQANYRMRFQAWLRNTKRDKRAEIVKLETKAIPRSPIYDVLPDKDAEYDAFCSEVVKRYRSGAITPEFLASLPDGDDIAGVIGLLNLGYLK